MEAFLGAIRVLRKKFTRVWLDLAILEGFLRNFGRGLEDSKVQEAYGVSTLGLIDFNLFGKGHFSLFMKRFVVWKLCPSLLRCRHLMC